MKSGNIKMNTMQTHTAQRKLGTGIFLLFISIMFAGPWQLNAQGMSRSNGIGLRFGFWNMYENKMSLRVQTTGTLQQVDVNGAGFYIDYFLQHNTTLTNKQRYLFKEHFFPYIRGFMTFGYLLSIFLV